MCMYPKKMYTLPLKIIMIYLIFSLALYALGPLEWVTYHPLLFWSLNILFLLSLYLGWKVGLQSRKNIIEWTEHDEEILARRLKPFLWLNLLFELLNAMRRFRYTSFNIMELIIDFINGLSNMGLSYSKYQISVDNVTGSYLVGGTALTIFNLMFSFIALNIVLLGGVLFKRYKIGYKLLIGFTYFFISVEYLSTGTNIGAFRMILAILVIIGIDFIRSRKILLKFSWIRKKRLFIILSIVGIVIVLSLFNTIMQSRGGILLWQSSTYNVGGIGLDRDSFIFKIMPSGLYMLLVSLSSYISQGYYGMSLSLNINWEPGFGFGHSKALQQLFSNILEPIHRNTYQYRLNSFGWDENVQWHTLYSWFANDFTYLGVIIIIFFIGYIFCKAYKGSIENNNPYAKVVTYYFVLMCVFIPCNNQVFQTTYSLFGFWGSLIAWFLSSQNRIKFSK